MLARTIPRVRAIQAVAFARQFTSSPVSCNASGRNSDRKTPRVESDLTHPSLLKDPPITQPSASTDPWSLVPPPPPPAQSAQDALDAISMEDLIASPHPEGRDSESTEILRKRLVYESRKRGILETDLILATFAQERLGSMADRELREYDRVGYSLSSQP